MRAALDTNILIDYLNGHEAAKLELDRHQDPVISVVTWMEVQVGARDEDELALLRQFMLRFDLVELTRPIARQAVRIRRDHRLRIPDAIIWATARESNCLLVTRNTRDFPRDDPGVRIPYVI